MVTLQAVLANLFVLKQTVLFGLQVTCSDVYAVGSLLALNLLQDRFGAKHAQQAIYISLFALVVFAVMGVWHLSYEPIPGDSMQIAYAALLTPAPRILAASLVTYGVVCFLDLWILASLRRSLVVGNAVSQLIAGFFDTVLFTFLGLYGIVDSVGQVILFSFCVKAAAILTTSVFLVYGANQWKQQLAKH